MMRICFALFTLFFVLSNPPSSWAKSERIAIVVNQDAISTSDVNSRLDMVIASSGLPNNSDIRSKLAEQVVSSLIEEQIKLQEAQRLELEITEEEVKSGFRAIAQQNNMEPKAFRTMLEKGRINVSSMERQIKSQIAWSKIIQSQLRPQVRISEKDIEAALSRIENSIGKNEYLVAEIYLPVEDPRKEGNVRQLASRLSSEIQNDKVPFFKVAQQFSKAAGAANGGDLGWIQQGQLTEQVDRAIQTMEKGQISAPIRSVNGYHIVLLRDSRLISRETLPSREDIQSNIGLQRLELLQRRHYLDLKAAAFIESRV